MRDCLLKKCGVVLVDPSELFKKVFRPSRQSVPPPAQPEIDETDEYRCIRQMVEAGYSEYPLIFVHGKAGSGKSTMIEYIRCMGNDISNNMAVVAPTGVAALNVNGATINSFFKLPPCILNPEKDAKKQPGDFKMYRKMKLLIIDEISMVRPDMLDTIDLFLRLNRGDDRSFGGVQVVLVGDLLQLPPVVKRQERSALSDQGYKSDYYVGSKVFRTIGKKMAAIELKGEYRQEEQSFTEMLNNIRVGAKLDECLPKVMALN